MRPGFRRHALASFFAFERLMTYLASGVLSRTKRTHHDDKLFGADADARKLPRVAHGVAAGHPRRMLLDTDTAVVLRAGGEACLLRLDTLAVVVRLPLRESARQRKTRRSRSPRRRPDATIVRRPTRTRCERQ